MVDISDSRGYSFFKDKEINISYFEKLKCELLNQNPTDRTKAEKRRKRKFVGC